MATIYINDNILFSFREEAQRRGEDNKWISKEIESALRGRLDLLKGETTRPKKQPIEKKKMVDPLIQYHPLNRRD